MTNRTKICFFLILLIAFCLRFWQLGKIPAGLTNDEADIGYDAYSILKTGKDQWGELPLVAFKGFGDYRLPVYTYLTVPFIAIFGLNQLAVRLPSAILGLITVWLTFKLVQTLLGTRVGLAAALLLAISPWHMAISRIGIESNTALFLTIFGFWLLYQGFKNKKYLWLSMLIFIASFYTYYSARVFVPALLALVLWLERKKLTLIRKDYLKFVIVGLILCLPIIISIINGSGRTRLGHLLFTKDIGLILNLNEKKGECLKKLPAVICRLSYNKLTAYLPKLITNYYNHFSLNLLFIKGSSVASSLMPPRGLLYLFEAPILLSGIYFLLVDKNQSGRLFLHWLILAPIANIFTGEEHISRMLTMLPSFQVISAYGLVKLLTWVKKVRLAKLMVPLVSLIITVSVGHYLMDYFVYYPEFYSSASHYGYQDLFYYLQNQKDNFQKIVISNKINDQKQYIFYLFYSRYDPKVYQSKNQVSSGLDKDGWVFVNQIGNFNFVRGLPDKTQLKSGWLLIGAPKEFPQEILTDKIISDLRGDELFKVVRSDNLIEYYRANVGKN